MNLLPPDQEELPGYLLASSVPVGEMVDQLKRELAPSKSKPIANPAVKPNTVRAPDFDPALAIVDYWQRLQRVEDFYDLGFDRLPRDILQVLGDILTPFKFKGSVVEDELVSQLLYIMHYSDKKDGATYTVSMLRDVAKKELKDINRNKLEQALEKATSLFPLDGARILHVTYPTFGAALMQRVTMGEDITVRTAFRNPLASSGLDLSINDSHFLINAFYPVPNVSNDLSPRERRKMLTDAKIHLQRGLFKPIGEKYFGLKSVYVGNDKGESGQDTLFRKLV